MSLITVNFFSQVLTRTVSFQAILPNDHINYLAVPKEERTPLKTLYLLHGMTGDCNDWITQSTILRAVEGYPLCVVMPSGENSFYSNSETIGRMYEDYICSELIDYTRSIFPLSEKREDTFIGGLSMGGYGAVVNGLRHPEKFGYVAAFSSALIKNLILRSNEESGLDYFTRIQYQTMFGLKEIGEFTGSEGDYEALAEKTALRTDKPRFYVDCGTEDESLIAANQKFKDKLQELGYEVTWESRPGTHSWEFWDESIRKALQWLPVEPLPETEKNPYVKKEKIMREAMLRKML